MTSNKKLYWMIFFILVSTITMGIFGLVFSIAISFIYFLIQNAITNSQIADDEEKQEQWNAKFDAEELRIKIIQENVQKEKEQVQKKIIKKNKQQKNLYTDQKPIYSEIIQKYSNNLNEIEVSALSILNKQKHSINNLNERNNQILMDRNNININKKFSFQEIFNFENLISTQKKIICINIIENYLLNLESNIIDLDAFDISEVKNIYNSLHNFLNNDLDKLTKIIERKNITVSYVDVVNVICEGFDSSEKREYKKFYEKEFKRISNILSDKKITNKIVLKEIIKKSNTKKEHCIGILEMFFNELPPLFIENIDSLIKEIKEEIEIDEFENELLTGKTKQKSIEDYRNLDGYEFEGYLAKLFKLLGYTVVPTPLSGDQGADLLVVKNNKKTAIQAKKYTGKVSNKAIQEVVAAKNHYKCDHAMVVTNSAFTKSAIELAMSNNVELWGQKKLDEMIAEVNSNNGNSRFKNNL